MRSARVVTELDLERDVAQPPSALDVCAGLPITHHYPWCVPYFHVLDVLGQRVGMFVLAAGVVALVGTFFQVSERWLVGRSLRWLPDALSAPVVAGLIAAVVAASIWILGGTTSAMLDLEVQQEISVVLRDIPLGLTGGLLGGAVTGILLELYSL
ncbi:hypothetical protein [Thiorhodococcus mannitoliphagus]|uniref:hypothetical protein n=1 Tax=Thiorhodococcus mannitoliphagus TaxID=329406 RepID=UPI001F0FC785|nr:hypothetical protein [Thiorhodococcus mannitoliphagus]